MAWTRRPEMDFYVLGQRLMTNLGLLLGNGMAYYSIKTLSSDLDYCSFGPPGSRGLLYGSVNGDVTSCRNEAEDTFKTCPTGGSSSVQDWLASFMLVQISFAIMLIITDFVHYRLCMLSSVTFLSLIQTVAMWLVFPCYPVAMAHSIRGFSVTCNAIRSEWRGPHSMMTHFSEPSSCTEMWLYRWRQDDGFPSYKQYIPFNLAFLLILGLALAMLFHLLSVVLLMPQTHRWVKDFRDSYNIALNPIYRIRRPGEEEDDF